MKILPGLDVELITGEHKQWANCVFQRKNRNGTRTSFTVESHDEEKIIAKARIKARQAGIPFMGHDPLKEETERTRKFEEGKRYIELPDLGAFKPDHSDKSHAIVISPGEGETQDPKPWRVYIPKSIYRAENGKRLVQKWWWDKTLAGLQEKGLQLSADGSKLSINNERIQERAKEREAGKQYVELPDLGEVKRNYSEKSHAIIVNWVEEQGKRHNSWRIYLAKSICREENGKIFVPRWWVEKNMRELERRGYQPGAENSPSEND